MFFDFLDDKKDVKFDNKFLSSIVEDLDEIIDKVNKQLGKGEIEKNKLNTESELYYVYSYAPPNVYITKQKSNKVELLENVSDEFINNLAEGFVLRCKDGKYSIDEELTKKSMNFELDFDNYKE